MRWFTRSIIMVNVLVLMGLAQAREVTFGGQVRPRFEFRSAGGGARQVHLDEGSFPGKGRIGT